jgi:hypothetical protein
MEFPTTAIERGLKPFDHRIDHRIKLGGPIGQILVVKKKMR